MDDRTSSLTHIQMDTDTSFEARHEVHYAK